MFLVARLATHDTVPRFYLPVRGPGFWSRLDHSLNHKVPTCCDLQKTRSASSRPCGSNCWVPLCQCNTEMPKQVLPLQHFPTQGGDETDSVELSFGRQFDAGQFQERRIRSILATGAVEIKPVFSVADPRSPAERAPSFVQLSLATTQRRSISIGSTIIRGKDDVSVVG